MTTEQLEEMSKADTLAEGENLPVQVRAQAAGGEMMVQGLLLYQPLKKRYKVATTLGTAEASFGLEDVEQVAACPAGRMVITLKK